MKSHKPKKIKTSLFLRIMLRLTIPLFILATIIAAILLMSQVQSMNRLYKIEGRLVFQTVYQVVGQALRDPVTLQHPEKLNEQILAALDFEQPVKVQIYDFYNKSFFLPTDTRWTAADNQSAEKSLYVRQKQNKPYFIRIDKASRLLLAYIPFQIQTDDKLLIVRVDYPLAHIEGALFQSRGTLLTLLVLILMTGVLIGRGLAKSIVQPIKTLHQATQDIMEGRFGKKVEINTGDELQTLAETFNHMSEALIGMKTDAEDANPLSGLPGNQAIKREIQRRIQNRQKFAVFHGDLDRFKVFNDQYGLAKGDEAISHTAAIMKAVLQESGTKDDFVGHQGGDDFVVILRAAHAKKIAEAIISRFDKEVVKALYSKEDFERGYVIALDRRGAAERGEATAVEAKFPLMGLSLAIVTNEKRDFASYDDILKRLVPVKKSVKANVSSCYEIQD